MPRTHRSAESYSCSSCCFNDALSAEAASFSVRVLDFPHAFFAPLHYERGYAYPLLVWLHGGGCDERQLQRIMPLVSMRNYVAVAPRGIALPEDGAGRREWCDWLQTEDHILHAEQRVFECMESAAGKYHVCPERVFLAGFDRGGTMAMRIALGHPHRFAGALSLCGAFPTGHAPFCNLVSARQLGFFLATSRASDKYPSAAVCADLRMIHAAGLSITLRQYPCGHELTAQMLADVDRWIIEQIAPTGGSAVAYEAEWSPDLGSERRG
ncbi:MAG: hypothetical protein JW959_06845 [Pirellulales bacterium]|nr:hypothetical protein [Pirellulales bacterium]